MREGQSADSAPAALEDGPDFLGGNIHGYQLLLLCGQVQFLGVGCPGQCRRISCLEGCQAGLGPGVIVGHHVHLILTALVGQPGNPLSVGRPYGVTVVGSGGTGEVVHCAFCGRHREDIAPEGGQHAAAVRREGECGAAGGGGAPGLDLVAGKNTLVIEIYGHLGAAAVLYGILVDVSSVLEDDPVLGEGGELAVVLGEVGNFLSLLGGCIIAEEVHDLIAVGEEVDLVPYPHREDVLGVVVGDVLELGGAHGVDPDIVGLASTVVLPGTELTVHAVQGQLGAVGRIGAEAALGSGNLNRLAALCRHCEEQSAERGEGIPAGTVDDALAVRGPAHDDVVRAHAVADIVAVHGGCIGNSLRNTALGRHGVDFGVAVVLSGEGYRLSVRREP